MNTTNKKLSKVIAGRTIKQSSQADGHLLVEFTDNAVMKIRSKDSASGCDGRIIQAVRQREKEFELVFTDNSSARINLAEETSCVMLRDHAGNLEYAD